MGQLSFNPDGSVNLPDAIKKDLEKEKKGIQRKIWEEEDGYESDEEISMQIWEQDEKFDDLKYNLEDDVSEFNLYKESQKLEPLTFSNNKTQKDIVNDVVKLAKSGKKVIFIKGVCGTGKSAIALNIGKQLGKASIVVPGKALQKQYRDDYSKEKYVLKNDHKKLRIKVITGRDNHKCLYKHNCSADFSELPCKIEIKESNMDKLKEYLKENSKVRNDLELKEIRRISIAPVCPFWSPIVPSEYELPIGANKRKYKGLKGIDFTIYNRKEGCTYYNQFNSYIDAESIIFNAAKYKLEVLMNRKPATDVEIIDECDEFLDSFSNVRRLNINRMLNSLNTVFPDDEKLQFIVRKIFNCGNNIIKDPYVRNLVAKKDITEIKKTLIYELLCYFVDNPNLAGEIDEDNYCQTVNEIALEFEEYFDEAYISFSLEERGLIANIATTNLSKKFNDLIDKSEVIVMMSGTIHSEKVLKDIFGIDDFAVIDAEVINQGEINVLRTGFEFDCKYENFSNGNISRESYLIALDKAIERAPRPTLVHVNSFDDLPSIAEKENYNLINLMTKQKLIELQQGDKENKMVEKFKSFEIPVLFTTKCNRGVDFPGEQCKSIVFTKYPNANVNSIFWKILRKTHPTYYWEFYRDKAKREFLQKIYRGVRSSDDHVYILSPDSRVLDAAEKIISANG
ncbi:MAG: helicase C-terminal domain-containing protein [Candidatus Pacearchaeota archaeon]|jgi:Rad3-related DNA helicase